MHYREITKNWLASLCSFSLQSCVLFSCKIHETHQLEVHDVISRLKKCMEENSQRKFAILVPQRGEDVNVLINELKYHEISFYNALNIDVNHKDYRLFHEICASEF